MSKTLAQVVDTGVVWLSKRGRPVSEATARSALQQLFPDIAPERWELVKATHRTIARLKEAP